jgi:large subunit ribosomal protein L1
MTTTVTSRHGKKYQEASKLVDRQQAYSLKEAVALLKRATYAKFDETVELHINTGCNPRQADQMVRGTVVLPKGLGKKVRVLVFTQADVARNAEQAGADYVGGDDLVKRIQDGWLEFDVAIATPDMMGRIGRLGPILGRKGLMPNPRSGTVVQGQDLPRAIDEARKGRVEYRLDRTGVIHVAVGKKSFSESDLSENITALVNAVARARPAGLKGTYIKGVTLTSTMGPGLKLDVPGLLALKAE